MLIPQISLRRACWPGPKQTSRPAVQLGQAEGRLVGDLQLAHVHRVDGSILACPVFTIVAIASQRPLGIRYTKRFNVQA